MEFTIKIKEFQLTFKINQAVLITFLPLVFVVVH